MSAGAPQLPSTARESSRAEDLERDHSPIESSMMSVLTIAVLYLELELESKSISQVEATSNTLLFATSLGLSIMSTAYGIYGLVPRMTERQLAEEEGHGPWKAAMDAAWRPAFKCGHEERFEQGLKTGWSQLQVFLMICFQLVFAFFTVGTWVGRYLPRSPCHGLTDARRLGEELASGETFGNLEVGSGQPVWPGADPTHPPASPPFLTPRLPHAMVSTC